jgi:hypothetical protein
MARLWKIRIAEQMISPLKKRVAGFNTPLKNMSQLGSLFTTEWNVIFKKIQTANQF